MNTGSSITTPTLQSERALYDSEFATVVSSNGTAPTTWSDFMIHHRYTTLLDDVHEDICLAAEWLPPEAFVTKEDTQHLLNSSTYQRECPSSRDSPSPSVHFPPTMVTPTTHSTPLAPEGG